MIDTFSYAGISGEGFKVIQKPDERGNLIYNYISEDGKILLKNWVKHADKFTDSTARIVTLDGESQYINHDGRVIISMEPYDKDHYACCSEFKGGFAVVTHMRKTSDSKLTNNVITKNGKLVFKQDYEEIDNLHTPDGIFRVKKDNRYFIIDCTECVLFDGKLDFWTDNKITTTKDGRELLVSKRNGKFVICNPRDKYDFIIARNPNLIIGKRDKMFYVLDSNSNNKHPDINLLYVEEPYGPVSHPLLVVRSDYKYNFLTGNGDFLYKEWFDYAEQFDRINIGIYHTRVCLNHRWNYLKTDGHLLSVDWFDYAERFDDASKSAPVRDFSSTGMFGSDYQIENDGTVYYVD